MEKKQEHAHGLAIIQEGPRGDGILGDGRIGVCQQQTVNWRSHWSLHWVTLGVSFGMNGWAGAGSGACTSDRCVSSERVAVGRSSLCCRTYQDIYVEHICCVHIRRNCETTQALSSGTASLTGKVGKLNTALSRRWAVLIVLTCEHGQRAESSVQWVGSSWPGLQEQ